MGISVWQLSRYFSGAFQWGISVGISVWQFSGLFSVSMSLISVLYNAPSCYLREVRNWSQLPALVSHGIPDD